MNLGLILGIISVSVTALFVYDTLKTRRRMIVDAKALEEVSQLVKKNSEHLNEEITRLESSMISISNEKDELVKTNEGLHETIIDLQNKLETKAIEKEKNIKESDVVLENNTDGFFIKFPRGAN